MCLGLFQKKKQQEGAWGQFFLKKHLELLGFLLYPSGNSRQNKASTLESPKNCVKPLGNSVLNKTKTPGNSTIFP